MASVTRPSSSGVQVPNELNVDRISALPLDVMNIIFGKLTILDTVRTSILARDWRYKWFCSSQLAIDSDALSLMLNHDERRWDVVSTVVYRYLRHHTNDIKSFSLKGDCGDHYPDMYQWINYLSNEDLEELIIESYCRSHFKVPAILFNFEQLVSLSLTNCEIEMPSVFRAFNWLTRLVLDDIKISDGCLESLIRSCPLLENLSLTNISGLNHLRIQAPRLNWLVSDTAFEDIVINAPYLAVVVIVASFREPEDRPLLNWRSVTHCLSILESLENVALSGEFIKFMAADFGASRYMLRNHNVNSLYLHDVRFEKHEVFSVCLDLLSSCRSIRSFRFSIKAAKGQKIAVKYFQELASKRCFIFSSLRLMVVTCPSNVGMGCAVNFIDFVIRHAPNLHKLTIQSEGGEGMNPSRVRNMMSRFQLSCPGALITYEQDVPLTDV